MVPQEPAASKVRRVLSRRPFTKFDIYKLFEGHMISRGAKKQSSVSAELTFEDVTANVWNYCSQLAVELVTHGMHSCLQLSVGANVMCV